MSFGTKAIPYDKNRDTIRTYAAKTSEHIPGDNPIILGHSYGGMLAVEIGKMRPTKKIFMVSSAKTTDELPHYGRFIRFVLRHGLIPGWYYNVPNPINAIVAGARNFDDAKLVSSMAMKTDGSFIVWALKSLLTWNNTDHPQNIVHIHGTADFVLPAKNVRPDYWIKWGGHVMVYNRADEISKIIGQQVF